MMIPETTIEVKRVAQKLLANLIIVPIVLVFIAGLGNLRAEEPIGPQQSTSIENDSDLKESSSISVRETQTPAAIILPSSPSEEVIKRVERYETLADGIGKWQINRQEVDTFYHKLNQFLGTKRDDFRDILRSL